jgi:hypothetical protein
LLWFSPWLKMQWFVATIVAIKLLVCEFHRNQNCSFIQPSSPQNSLIWSNMMVFIIGRRSRVLRCLAMSVLIVAQRW